MSQLARKLRPKVALVWENVLVASLSRRSDFAGSLAHADGS